MKVWGCNRAHLEEDVWWMETVVVVFLIALFTLSFMFEALVVFFDRVKGSRLKCLL